MLEQMEHDQKYSQSVTLVPYISPWINPLRSRPSPVTSEIILRGHHPHADLTWSQEVKQVFFCSHVSNPQKCPLIMAASQQGLQLSRLHFVVDEKNPAHCIPHLPPLGQYCRLRQSKEAAFAHAPTPSAIFVDLCHQSPLMNGQVNGLADFKCD